MLGIFTKGSTKDATEYLYEYRMQKRKRWESFMRTSDRITAVILCGYLFLVARFMLPATISQAPACGSLIGVMMLVSLVGAIIVIFNPDLLISDDTPLIVRVSQEIVFVRHYEPFWTSARIFSENITIGQIKNADVKTYSEDEYNDLHRRINDDFDYEKGLSRWSKDPIRWLLSDGSSKDTIAARRCAVLEVVDGRTFFIEFEGVKEFVSLVNKLRANIS